MNVIHIEEETFFELIEMVVARLSDKFEVPNDKWIDGDEAMRLLRIKSLTTLQKYRDEGKIEFSQPSKKVILYNRFSIEEFIEKHKQVIF